MLMIASGNQIEVFETLIKYGRPQEKSTLAFASYTLLRRRECCSTGS